MFVLIVYMAALGISVALPYPHTFDTKEQCQKVGTSIVDDVNDAEGWHSTFVCKQVREG